MSKQYLVEQMIIADMVCYYQLTNSTISGLTDDNSRHGLLLSTHKLIVKDMALVVCTCMVFAKTGR